MYAWVKKKEGNSKKDPRVKNRKSPKKEYNIKILNSATLYLTLFISA